MVDMALQSQEPRTTARRTTSKGGSTPTKLMLAAGLVVVIGLGALAVWRFGFGGGQGMMGSGAKVAVADPSKAPGAGADGKTSPTGPTAQPRAGPTSLEMGQPAGSGSTLVPVPGGNAGSLMSPGNPALENPTSPNAPVSPVPGAMPQPNGQPMQPGTTTGPAAGNGVPSETREMVEAANRSMASNKLVEARTLLNKALFDRRLPAEERRALRSQIAAINETLVFGPGVAAGDPLTDTYVIQSGDSLVTLTRKQGLPVDWRFIQRINKIVRPEALRVGQKIKIVRAPFHAIVHKSDFRVDLYMGDPPSSGATTGPDGQDSSWTYIRSFPVGLGESNGTPEGLFVVRPKSKLVNPRWVNPRTGEVFEAENLKNPIGEHWLGLDGAEEATKKFAAYGMHGTIDPASVGKSMSMGCVRLLSDDIATVYEMLTERISTVKIIR